jgi:hypothetical protein
MVKKNNPNYKERITFMTVHNITTAAQSVKSEFNLTLEDIHDVPAYLRNPDVYRQLLKENPAIAQEREQWLIACKQAGIGGF